MWIAPRRILPLACVLAVLAPLAIAAPHAVSSISRITEIYVSPFNMSGPARMAVDASRQRAYALSSIPNRLWVLDTGTNQQVASFATDGSIPSDVAVDAQAGRVYVTHTGSPAISVLDAATNTWLAPIDVGVGTQNIALLPARHRAYVTTYDRTVLVVDTANGSVVRTLRDPGFKTTKDIAVDSLRSRVYVQNEGNTGISVINALTNRVIDVIDTGHATNAVAVDAAMRRVYVGNDDGTFSVIDTANDADTVLATISVSSGISDVAVNPALRRAYATNFLDNTVTEIDTRTNTVIGTSPVGNDPVAIAVDTTARREFVASYNADYVSVLGE